MNHKELIEEAKELAKGKTTGELAEMAFVYSYVANHELRMVWGRLGSMEKIVLGVGIAVITAIIVQIIRGA